jgi:hypothetical protein
VQNRLLPAILVAAALWTPPASAQVQIDTSTPESVMASLAGLHESWTLIQFTEFMRAAMVSRLPDEVEQPESWQGARNRWEFLPDSLALFAGISIYMPLILESDPFVGLPNPEKSGPWLQETLRSGLEGRAVEALVRFGRNRERAVLIELRERAAMQLREFEEQAESAAAARIAPGHLDPGQARLRKAPAPAC